jgi:hypothetical protein
MPVVKTMHTAADFQPDDKTKQKSYFELRRETGEAMTFDDSFITNKGSSMSKEIPGRFLRPAGPQIVRQERGAQVFIGGTLLLL